MAFGVRSGRPGRTAGGPVAATAATLRGTARVRAPQAARTVRRRRGAGRRTHSGAPLRQHVVAELEQPLRHHGALPRPSSHRRHAHHEGTGSFNRFMVPERLLSNELCHRIIEMFHEEVSVYRKNDR